MGYSWICICLDGWGVFGLRRAGGPSAAAASMPAPVAAAVQHNPQSEWPSCFSFVSQPVGTSKLPTNKAKKQQTKQKNNQPSYAIPKCFNPDAFVAFGTSFWPVHNLVVTKQPNHQENQTINHRILGHPTSLGDRAILQHSLSLWLWRPPASFTETNKSCSSALGLVGWWYTPVMLAKSQWEH